MSLKGMSVPLDLLPNGKRIMTDVNSVDVGLNTLFNAITKDRLPMVRSIIRVKAINEEMTNSAGMTPTMFAASLGRKEMVELFLSKGCNPHKKCNQGKTALDYARENNQQECAQVLEEYMAKVEPPKEDNCNTEAANGKDIHTHSLFSRLFGFLRGSKKAA
jgi:hypothetical protein